MSFNINEFIAQLSSGNLSRTTHFRVLISGPQNLQSVEDEQDMIFRCEAATEPGRSISVNDSSYYYGLPLARASGSTFGEIDLTFILSEDYREKLYFERWQDLMVGPYRSGGVSQDMYDIGYFDDYVGSMQIMRFNQLEQLTHTTYYENVFPNLS